MCPIRRLGFSVLVIVCHRHSARQSIRPIERKKEGKTNNQRCSYSSSSVRMNDYRWMNEWTSALVYIEYILQRWFLFDDRHLKHWMPNVNWMSRTASSETVCNAVPYHPREFTVLSFIVLFPGDAEADTFMIAIATARFLHDYRDIWYIGFQWATCVEKTFAWMECWIRVIFVSKTHWKQNETEN